MKVTSGLNLIKKAIQEMDNQTEEEKQAEIDKYEWKEETRIEETREKLFAKISITERAKPETREWFNNLTWYKYDNFNRRVADRLYEHTSYLNTENFSDDEIAQYLKNERQDVKKELIKTAIGRELIENYTEEFFLQLFNDTTLLQIQNENGETFHFDKKQSAEISPIYADYKAIEVLQKEHEPEIPGNPTLEDIARTKEYYEIIIEVLADMKYIDPDTRQWKKRNRGYQKLIANLIWSLKGIHVLKKVEMTHELANQISKNTFGIGFSPRTSQTDDSDNPLLEDIINAIKRETETKSNLRKR